MRRKVTLLFRKARLKSPNKRQLPTSISSTPQILNSNSGTTLRKCRCISNSASNTSPPPQSSRLHPRWEGGTFVHALQTQAQASILVRFVAPLLEYKEVMVYEVI